MDIQEVGLCVCVCGVGGGGGVGLAGLDWIDLAVTFEMRTEMHVGV
jgi:hypothetical protein